MGNMLKILLGCALFALITEVGGQGVPLTLVTGAVEKRAVCLDGSPAGYHLDPGSGDGVNNWIVHLFGGGWCGHWTCWYRLHQFHGSTAAIGLQKFSGLLSSNKTSNPDFYNWNRVAVRYCDGGSFLGDTEADDHGNLVQLRGSKIWSGVIDDLLQVKGMSKAENAMLSGSSAGGLSALFHCDDFGALLPNAKRVKCLSDSGFFIQAPAIPNVFIVDSFASVAEFRNLTEFLPKPCTSKMNASLCMLPEFFVDDIKTPLFILNSVYDTFQVQHLRPAEADRVDWNTKCTNTSTNTMPLPSPSICKPSLMKLINDLRDAFLDTIDGLADIPSRGFYIDACYHHVYAEADSSWSGDTLCKLENKTISQAVADWYFDRSSVKLIDRKSQLPLNCDVALYGNPKPEDSHSVEL